MSEKIKLHPDQMAMLEVLTFHRYLVSIHGPSSELYNIITRSLLPKELHLALESEKALTPKIKVILEHSYEKIRPALNKGSFRNKNYLFSCLDSGGIQTDNFELFAENLKNLLLKVEYQEVTESYLISDKKETYLLRLSARSFKDESLALSSLQFSKSLSEKDRYIIISSTPLLAKYITSKFGEPSLPFYGVINAELLLTIETLSNQGGIYENFETAVRASLRLLK